MFNFRMMNMRFRGMLSRLAPTVRETWAGKDPNFDSKKYAVFVHFDPDHHIDDTVSLYVRELCKNGFRIIFVSNNNYIHKNDLFKIIESCSIVVHRRNIGYDFGAYLDGIKFIKKSNDIETLLLANDSVYGPLFPLSDIMEKCDKNTCDVWSMTDSKEITYHLQSYFLLIHQRAIRSGAFRKFWRSYPFLNDKKWVVQFGEIGFSQAMQRSGIRIGAAFSCEDADLRRRYIIQKVCRKENTGDSLDFCRRITDEKRSSATYNPTHYYWEYLIENEGYPFIKKDLIKTNPSNIYGVDSWGDVLSRNTNFDCSLIKKHLKIY